MANIKYNKEEPANNLIMVSIVLTTVFLVGIFIFSYYLFVAFLSVEQNTKYDLIKTSLKQQYDTQHNIELNQFKYTDDTKQFVKVPIKYGIDYVIKKYNK
tara:strand:+ start:142 stop:441 length:300 start_codon:yes stop_codon:yes gene_type:complete